MNVVLRVIRRMLAYIGEALPDIVGVLPYVLVHSRKFRRVYRRLVKRLYSGGFLKGELYHSTKEITNKK